MHDTGFVDVGNRTVQHPDGTKSGDWRQALIEVRTCILLKYMNQHMCVRVRVCAHTYNACAYRCRACAYIMQ